MRPRSGSPWEEEYSSRAKERVRSRCVCGGRDCSARGRRAWARDGFERVVRWKVAAFIQREGDAEPCFERAAVKRASAFCDVSI